MVKREVILLAECLHQLWLLIRCLNDFSIFPLGSFFTIIVGMIEKKTVNQNNTFRFHDSPMFLSKDTAPQNLGNIYPFFVIINEKDEHAEFIYCMLNLAKQYAISIHVLLALLERDRIRKQYTNTHAVTCIPNCIPVCMCRFCVLCYGFGLSGAHASLLDWSKIWGNCFLNCIHGVLLLSNRFRLHIFRWKGLFIQPSWIIWSQFFAELCIWSIG